jgi:3-oxoacid CoA-transferase subunit A
MDKESLSALEAISDVADGATVMVGGYGHCGVPESLLRALCERRSRNLTIIVSNAMAGNTGIGRLLENRQIKRVISTYVEEEQRFEELMLNGDLVIELLPQGTFAERIRAGGAGIGAFYTPTGFGTIIAEGKEMRTWDNRHYVLEFPLRADFAFVKAWKGDRRGNLIYRGAARNFNPVMATAAATTIAEVEELVSPGELEPDSIHTPEIFVQRIVQGAGD